MNSLQPNPGNAATNLVQPDWNSKYGDGVEPASDAADSFDAIYARQKTDAASRFAADPDNA